MADETLAELIEQLGPRRVRTKNIEIEGHSPEVVQRLLERRMTRRVGLTRIPFNKAVPKNGGHCEDY